MSSTLKFGNKILFSIMVFIWGINWSAMKIGLGMAPVFTFNFHRFLFSTIFLLLLCIIKKVEWIKGAQTNMHIIIYCLTSVFGFTLTTIGLIYESSGISAVLTYTQPIWVFLLSIFILNEVFSLTKFLGIFLGFSGIVILFLKGIGSIGSFSSILIIFGAILWAVSTVYYKMKLENVDPIYLNFYNSWIATLIALTLSLILENPFEVFNLNYFLVTFYSGVFASGIGMTIWVFLLKNESAVTLSSSSLIVPLLALIFSAIILGEEIGYRTIIGSTLVLSGVYLVNRKKLVK
ncbi:MAG: DMT family transporter [Nitrososphaeria archaeon]|nr:DMT family transporter [Nitrososphaeria archaeon]